MPIIFLVVGTGRTFVSILYTDHIQKGNTKDGRINSKENDASFGSSRNPTGYVYHCLWYEPACTMTFLISLQGVYNCFLHSVVKTYGTYEDSIVVPCGLSSSQHNNNVRLNHWWMLSIQGSMSNRPESFYTLWSRPSP